MLNGPTVAPARGGPRPRRSWDPATLYNHTTRHTERLVVLPPRARPHPLCSRTARQIGPHFAERPASADT